MFVKQNGIYGIHAGLYDQIYFDEEKYRDEINFIFGKADLKPGFSQVLDVGCGTGTHAALLVEKGVDVTGIDLNLNMLRHAVQKCPAARFIRSDMRNFQLDRKFVVVSCLFGAFNYLPTKADIRDALANFLHHLHLGGTLVIETRWSKNLPEASWVEYRGDTVVTRRWGRQRGIDGSDIYVLNIFDKANDMHLLDIHNLYHQDPFMIAGMMEEAGFGSIEIFEDRYLEVAFLPTTGEHEALILGKKPR